jgi:hypothetical protein
MPASRSSRNLSPVYGRRCELMEPWTVAAGYLPIGPLRLVPGGPTLRPETVCQSSD